MLELYRNIKRRREELGITQGQLAELIGYADKTMISKIENGAVDLAQSKIVSIAKALKTTPAALMGWENQPIVPADGQSESYYVDAETRQLAQELHDDPELSVMLDAYRSLSPRDAKLVMDMVRRMQNEGTD